MSQNRTPEQKSARTRAPTGLLLFHSRRDERRTRRGSQTSYQKTCTIEPVFAVKLLPFLPNKGSTPGLGVGQSWLTVLRSTTHAAPLAELPIRLWCQKASRGSEVGPKLSPPPLPLKAFGSSALWACDVLYGCSLVRAHWVRLFKPLRECERGLGNSSD